MPANNSPEMAANGPGTSGADPYAPTSWGMRYEDLTVPSGQTCRVRRVGIEQLVVDGAIEDLDTLTDFVNKNHIEPKAKSVKNKSGNPAKQRVAANKQAAKLLGGASSDDLRRMFRLMDAVVMAAVDAPKLFPVPGDGQRVEGRVYIDEVDAADKSFIMNYVFAGVKDLEQFRREFTETAASLGNVEDLEVSAE